MGREYDEDEWSKWHHEEEYTGNVQEDSSKESSFVVVSNGKGLPFEVSRSPSKEENSSDPDIMEALKMVIENNQKTVEMVINAQKDESTSEEDKLDQEDQRMKMVELEKLENQQKKVQQSFAVIGCIE